MRISMGDECVTELIAHFMDAARLHPEPIRPGVSARFMSPDAVDALYRQTYLDPATHAGFDTTNSDVNGASP